MCPGRIERKESSSGAPRKMLGIKSRKVWVIAIETMKTTKIIGGVSRKYSDKDNKKTAMRFMWMPGVRPVRVPARSPIRVASISCNNMEF